MKTIAIVGIHTGIGKTIASAVVAEAIGADYWKPVQAGLEERDTTLVASLLTGGAGRVHDEAVALTEPMSPHAAAAIDGVVIDYKKFAWPVSVAPYLIAETAGGVLSPISGDSTMADFVAHYHLPAILVVQHYLGSISHTLLCIEVLKARGIELIGIIINGNEHLSSESFITQYAGVPVIARIPQLAALTQAAIAGCAAQAKTTLMNIINP